MGSFCTYLKFINIFMFYVDFGIRGILYIFLGKDLIVIMILHLVILILNFCTCHQQWYTVKYEPSLYAFYYIWVCVHFVMLFSSQIYKISWCLYETLLIENTPAVYNSPCIFIPCIIYSWTKYSCWGNGSGFHSVYNLPEHNVPVFFFPDV